MDKRDEPTYIERRRERITLATIDGQRLIPESRLAAAEKVCQAVGRAKECRIGSPKYEPCSGCSNTIYATHDEWMEVVQKGGS